jgi:DNA polymerase-3 subunit gamma/tau
MTEVLYRKYRPKKFDEVVGQDQVVSALKESIKGNLSHAYIFAGSRGTGKTSIARIFSEALGTSGTDLYEIDAASNRGIDDIRAIKEAVHTMPFESKYKVYIIDEAHMLTREAWNALLKTLEEPPAHVVFILATTELEKIPETILSRCQTFQFKKPSDKTLREVIAVTAKKEGYKVEPEALDIIVLLADGSFRDAHGALQKAINGSKEKVITLEALEAQSNAPKHKLIEDFITAFTSKNLPATLSVIEKIEVDNLDTKLFLRLLIEKMREILLLRVKSDTEKLLKEKLSPERLSFAKSIAENKALFLNADVLKEFLTVAGEIERSFMPTLSLELVVIKLLS